MESNERLQRVFANLDVESIRGKEVGEGQDSAGSKIMLKRNEDTENNNLSESKILSEAQESNEHLLPVISRITAFQPLGRADISRRLTGTMVPLFGVGLVKMGQTITVAILVSRLGKEVMAADGLIATYADFLLQSTLAFLNPISPLVAEAFEQNDFKKVGEIVKQGWLLAGLLSIPVMTFQFYSEQFFLGIGISPEIARIIGANSRISCFATPAIYGMEVDYNFLKATKREKVLFPFYMVTVGLGTTLFYLLSTGSLGFPELGYTGLGYTVVFQFGLTFLSVKIYFRKKEFERYELYPFSLRGLLHFSLRNLLRKMKCFSLRDLQQLKRIFKYGCHIYILSVADLGTALVTGVMIGNLDVVEMAINQTVISYQSFARALIDSIRQSTQVHVSRLKSARDYSNMQGFGNMGIFWEVGTNIIPSVLMLTIPIQMCQLFIDEDLAEYESIIRAFFAVKAISKLFESIEGPSIENLKGIFDNKFPALVQFVTSLSIILPLSYVMAFVLGLDLTGVGLASLTASLIRTPTLLYRWYAMSHNDNYLDNTSPASQISEASNEVSRTSLLESKNRSDRETDLHQYEPILLTAYQSNQTLDVAEQMKGDLKEIEAPPIKRRHSDSESSSLLFSRQSKYLSNKTHRRDHNSFKRIEKLRSNSH